MLIKNFLFVHNSKPYLILQQALIGIMPFQEIEKKAMDSDELFMTSGELDDDVSLHALKKDFIFFVTSPKSYEVMKSIGLNVATNKLLLNKSNFKVKVDEIYWARDEQFLALLQRNGLVINNKVNTSTNSEKNVLLEV